MNRTYCLSGETVRRIDALADKAQVSQSRLADYFLRMVLDDIDAGRFTLRTRPIAYEIDPGA